MKKLLLLLLLSFVYYNASAKITWIGNHTTSSQLSTSQTIHFYVVMNDHYTGTHAEVVINEGGTWTHYSMAFSTVINGNNSTWVVNVNVKSTATEYYFHGWDNWGANVYDNNGSSNYSISINPTTSTNGNWNNPSIWPDGSVPSSTTANYVIANNVNLDKNVTIGSLNINSGGALSINVNKALTVNGTLTNNAGNSGLVIQSDATGTGSLIVGSGTPAANVNRYLTGYTSSSNGWHLLSAPVSAFAFSGAFAPASGTDNLYRFDESNTSTPWLNYVNTATFVETTFQVGEGYLVAYATGGTRTFTGNINTGSYTKNLSYTSGAAYAGWNLLGNPYTSAIDWSLVTKSSAHVDGTVYVLRASDDTYIDWNGSIGGLIGGIIPANQGFFVYTNATGQSITMKPADQVHSTTNISKSSEKKAPNTLKVSLKEAQNENDTYIQFRSDATKSFDNAIDGLKLFGLGSVSEIYTDKNDTLYSINCIPLNLTNYDLPIGVKIQKEGKYSLNFSGLSTFNNNMKFILEDTQTGTLIDLSQQTTYDFSAAKGDDPSRFVLHINGVTAVPNVNKADDIQVFAFGNTVYLHGQQNLNGRISIFNTLGQQVYVGVLNGAAKQQIRLNQRQGIYFVRLEESNRVVTKKVFIQ